MQYAGIPWLYRRKNLTNIPTAFSGTWGSGKPVIAFMGEYDALSGLSQKAEHAQFMKENPYVCPIPADVQLPTD